VTSQMMSSNLLPVEGVVVVVEVVVTNTTTASTVTTRTSMLKPPPPPPLLRPPQRLLPKLPLLPVVTSKMNSCLSGKLMNLTSIHNGSHLRYRFRRSYHRCCLHLGAPRSVQEVLQAVHFC
jgi:hypothetical protein